MQQLPDFSEFDPHARLRPATRVLFEQPVDRLRRAGRAVQALATPFVEGLDISKWQAIGQIDWPALYAGGLRWVVVKASEGTTIMDQNFVPHAEGALEAGVWVMPYHFFRSNLPGVAQAEHFLSVITPLLDQLGYTPPLWGDVETVDGMSNANRLSRLQSFSDHLVGAVGGDRPGVYTSPGFANTSLTPTPGWINSLHHWIAHWTSASLPAHPTGWDVGKRRAWQYGVWNDHPWCPPVPGCSPDIDRDKFFGTEEELAAFVGAPPPPTLEGRVFALEEEARAHGWDI